MKSKLFCVLILTVVMAFLCGSIFAKEIEKDDVKAVKNNQNVTVESVNLSINETSTTNPVDSKHDSPASKALAGETINWYVISGGGGYGESDNFKLNGTVGQNFVGRGESGGFILLSGFWQDFESSSGCCIGIRGNFDGDGEDAIDIADIVFMVEYQFLSSGIAPPCFEEGDIAPYPTDDPPGPDGSIDIADLVKMVEYQFLSGPPPSDC